MSFTGRIDVFIGMKIMLEDLNVLQKKSIDLLSFSRTISDYKMVGKFPIISEISPKVIKSFYTVSISILSSTRGSKLDLPKSTCLTTNEFDSSIHKDPQ